MKKNNHCCEYDIPFDQTELCKCPEKILEKFSLSIGQKYFYYEDFEIWMINMYGKNSECDALIEKVLNLEGIEKIWDSPYGKICRINASRM